MKTLTTIQPPYTNRWGCTPGPEYKRCTNTTASGAQCRRGAERGHDTCRQHRIPSPTVAAIERLGMSPKGSE